MVSHMVLAIFVLSGCSSTWLVGLSGVFAWGSAVELSCLIRMLLLLPLNVLGCKGDVFFPMAEFLLVFNFFSGVGLRMVVHCTIVL